MKEIPQNKTPYKRMQLNFYQQNDNKPKYVGGRRNIDFRYVTPQVEFRRMMKRKQKQRAKMLISRPLLQTLSGYIEAAKCKTLDQFAKEAKT